MINQKQLLNNVVYPVLHGLEFDKTPEARKNAAALLMYTCMQESHGGEFIKQLGTGPALGIMQMEPNTFNDIVDNYIMYRPEIWDRVNEVTGTQGEPDCEEMVYNLALSVAMARIHYRRTPPAIPAWDDLEGMWKLYKKYYNSVLGAATKEEFMHNAKTTQGKAKLG